MSGYTLCVFLAIVLFTTTQGFSWGRVFNNDDEKNIINEGEASKRTYEDSQIRHTHSHTQMIPEEVEMAERPLPDNTPDNREKNFRVARTEEVNEEDKRMPRLGQEKPLHAEERTARRLVEPGSGATGTEQKTDRDAELHALQKEVGEINHPLGPDTPPEKVEVIGVPREREHHITDGLADAIAGLMRVYNSLVRSDGREWDTTVHPSVNSGLQVRKDDMNGTTEILTESEKMGVAEAEIKKKGGWAPLGVLAGIVVVAGAGVLLVGFAQRGRESPVYPPSGPAYV